MPNRRKKTVDIREVIQHLRRYQSDRAVQRATGVHRQTVKRYRSWAAEQGLLEGPLPPLAELEQLVRRTLPELPPPQNVSSVEPYRDMVKQLRKEGVEIAAICQRLRDREFKGSYSAVRRFVNNLETVAPEVFVRVECRPGEEVQVDFGYAGLLLDPEMGELRRAWAFVMTVSWSRHQYVEFVFDQKLPTWLLLHRHAFEWLGGVPERVVLDNLKAAVVKACFDDPLIQQAYRECAEHYGFLIAPCRPRTPRHKGKVEQGGVHYVKRNFVAGRAPTSITQANQDVRVWCNTTAGLRIHGTTRARQFDTFAVERSILVPLPEVPPDPGTWLAVTMHRDCHVSFERALYSVPFALEGKALWLRDTQDVLAHNSRYGVARPILAGQAPRRPARIYPPRQIASVARVYRPLRQTGKVRARWPSCAPSPPPPPERSGCGRPKRTWSGSEPPLRRTSEGR